MVSDQLYMRRALELASLGEVNARPNPMVGAVIVHEGRIIGEGYHHAYGQPHAEVMAINSVRNKALLPHSTLYVSLEPCSHYGKTPPCASLIIHHKIPKVMVAMLDPYPKVSGSGIKMLKDSGIEVTTGLLEREAQALNTAFICQYVHSRPLVTLKWAESRDGFIDRIRTSADEAPTLFSSAYRLRLVHRARMRHQAILVGYRTALLDNPSLNTRYWYGHSPIRIVVDPRLSLPKDLRILSDNAAPTWILYNEILEAPINVPKGVRYIPMHIGKQMGRSILDVLIKEGIQSVMIEGGSSTLQCFIDEGLYDSLEREIASCALDTGVPAPKI